MRYTCRECSSRPQVRTCSPANCRSPRCTECSGARDEYKTRRRDRLLIDAATTCDNKTCQFRRKIKQFSPETSDESLDYHHHKNRKEMKTVRCTCEENSITEYSDDSSSRYSKSSSRKIKICTPYICTSRQRDKLLLDAGTTYKSPSRSYDNYTKSYKEVTCICSDNLQYKSEYSDEDLHQMKYRSTSCGVCLERKKSVSTQENYECLDECPYKTNRSTNTQPCTPATCTKLAPKMPDFIPCRCETNKPKPCDARTCPRFVDFRAKETKVSSTESEVTSCDSTCIKYADVTDDKSSVADQTTGDGDQPTSDLTKTSSKISQESSEPCSPDTCLYHTTEEIETAGESKSASSKEQSVTSETCSPNTCWYHTTDEIETTCQSMLKAEATKDITEKSFESSIGDTEVSREDGSKKSTTSEKSKSTSGRGSKQSLTISEKTLTNITEHESTTSTSGHESKSSITSHTMSSIERAKLEGKDSADKECSIQDSSCKASAATGESGDDKRSGSKLSGSAKGEKTSSQMSTKHSSALDASGKIADELLEQVIDLSDAGSKAQRSSLSDTSSGRRNTLGIPPDGMKGTQSELGSADGDVQSGTPAMGESDEFEYNSTGELVRRRKKDDARSRTSSGELIEYDSKGQVIPRRKKDGFHHTDSRTSSEMARLGAITSSGQLIEYDSKGQVIPRRKKDGPHHTDSRTSSEMARLGAITSSGQLIEYDSKGQVIPRRKKDGPHHSDSRTSSEMARLVAITSSGQIIEYDSKGQVIPRRKKDGPHHTDSRTSSEMARLGAVTSSGQIIEYDSKGQVIPRRKKGGPHHTDSRTSSEMARLVAVTSSGQIIEYDSKGQVIPRRKKGGPRHTDSRTSSEMARLAGVTSSGQIIEYDSKGQVIPRRKKDGQHHTDSRTSSEMARLAAQLTSSGQLVEYDSKGQVVPRRKKDGPLQEFDEYDSSGPGRKKGRGRGDTGGDDSGEDLDRDGRHLPQKPSDFSTTLDHGTRRKGGPGDQDEEAPGRGRGVKGVDSSLTKLLLTTGDKRAPKTGPRADGSRTSLGFDDGGKIGGKGVGRTPDGHLPGCRCNKCKKIGCSCGVAEGFQPYHPPGCHCNNCKLTICKCEISGPKSPNYCGCNACDQSKHPENCDCVDCLCDPSQFQKSKGQDGGDHGESRGEGRQDREVRDGGGRRPVKDDEERKGRGRRDSEDDNRGRKGGRGRKKGGDSEDDERGGSGGRRGRRGGSGGRRGSKDSGDKGAGGRKPRKGRRGKGRDDEDESDDDRSSSSEHPSDCDCAECLCAPSEISTVKKPQPKTDAHPPECDCVDCICKPCLNRLCIMKKSFVCPTLVPMTKRHHPDCKCDNCICDECLHVPDCKCHDCKCRRCADEKVHRAKQKCTCPECVCNPCGDMTKRHPREDYHGEDCTCADCICAPCDDTRVAKEKAKLRHPPECVCYLCSCKNCADPRVNPPSYGPSMFQSLVQSANVCNFTPIKYEIPHGPDCKCVKCTCRACEEPKAFVEKTRDPSKSVGIDTHGPDCYCPQCFCNPCKSKQDAYTPTPVLDKKECVCDKCVCNPCDDPIFHTRRILETIKSQQHGDGCQCPICLAEAKRAHNHGEGCQCPLCLAESAAAKRPHHGEGCMCPLCLPVEEKHGPDCKCPKCVCDPCRQDEPVKEHGADCKCAVCKPGEDDKKVTPEKPKHQHCPNCKCPTCLCDPCDKDEPEKQPQHGPDCRCPTCLCSPCEKDIPAEQTPHKKECTCDRCVCDPCDDPIFHTSSSKSRQPKPPNHGPDCKCPACVCYPCESKKEEEPVKQGVDYKYIDQLIQASKQPVKCVCNSKGKPVAHPQGCRCKQCVCCPSSKKTPQAITQGTSFEFYTKSTQCVCKKKHLQSAKVSKVSKINRQKEIDEIESLLVNLRAVCCEAKAREAEIAKDPQANMTEGALLALMQELRTKTTSNVVQHIEQPASQKETNSRKGSCFCGDPPTNITTTNQEVSSAVSSPLQITEVSRISDESILVKWTQPTNSNATGYEITIDDAVQSKVHSYKRTSAVIFGIQGRRRIHIAVHVVTPQGRSGIPALSVYEG